MQVKIGQGKRWIIADIHGCIHTLRALWQKIQVSTEDQVFFLGDYIDRGTDSGAVIDQILAWKKDFQIYTLMGNHEKMFLNANPDRLAQYAKEYHCWTLLNENQEIFPHYFQFLNELYFYIEMPDAILAHAGLNFHAENIFEDTESMLWLRPYWFGKNNTEKILFHGHTPLNLEQIQQDIQTQKNIICLDNGCVYAKMKGKRYAGLGNLLAYELNSGDLYVQESQEKDIFS